MIVKSAGHVDVEARSIHDYLTKFNRPAGWIVADWTMTAYKVAPIGGVVGALSEGGGAAAVLYETLAGAATQLIRNRLVWQALTALGFSPRLN